jgi:hypothetical protein
MNTDPVKHIPIAAEIADGLATRLYALEGAVHCIRMALEGGEKAQERAAVALFGVADEIVRIASDLDVCAWDRFKPKTSTATITRKGGAS